MNTSIRKRFLSLVMALLMLISTMPVNAFGSEAEDLNQDAILDIAPDIVEPAPVEDVAEDPVVQPEAIAPEGAGDTPDAADASVIPADVDIQPAADLRESVIDAIQANGVAYLVINTIGAPVRKSMESEEPDLTITSSGGFYFADYVKASMIHVWFADQNNEVVTGYIPVGYFEAQVYTLQDALQLADRYITISVGGADTVLFVSDVAVPGDEPAEEAPNEVQDEPAQDENVPEEETIVEAEQQEEPKDEPAEESVTDVVEDVPEEEDSEPVVTEDPVDEPQEELPAEPITLDVAVAPVEPEVVTDEVEVTEPKTTANEETPDAADDADADKPEENADAPAEEAPAESEEKPENGEDAEAEESPEDADAETPEINNEENLTPLDDVIAPEKNTNAKVVGGYVGIPAGTVLYDNLNRAAWRMLEDGVGQIEDVYRSQPSLSLPPISTFWDIAQLRSPTL